jgi:hypothetical protein
VARPASATGPRDPKRRCYGIRSLVLTILAALLALAVPTAAQAHAPGCRSHRCDANAYRLYLKHHPFTGYVVSGPTSTFGYLTGDSEGQTADGGTTARPCIAIRDDSTLGHWFLVEVLGHKARLLHCDWGPGIRSRAIDITGLGDQALGLSPTGYPTEAWGVARELR